VTPLEFCRHLWHQKTRVRGLLYGVALMILHLAVLVHCRLVTDRRTDGQTKGWTHGDSTYRISTALCCKNAYISMS